MSAFKLFTEPNRQPKGVKGEKHGYMTFILHLAPADLSGFNVCPMATAGCKAACLNTAGRGGWFKPGATTNRIQEARKRKTRWFFEDRVGFMEALADDIIRALAYAERRNLTPVFRLNGTSDIRWETIPYREWPNLMAFFDGVQFYDYTKIGNRKDLPANYHLTFSAAENNEVNVKRAIRAGMNVAVVFRKPPYPAAYLNRRVVDGDESDLRFLDPANSIIGLKAKGRAKKDTTGFVRDVQPDVGSMAA